jgi:diacylglycerol kinase (ATP)
MSNAELETGSLVALRRAVVFYNPVRVDLSVWQQAVAVREATAGWAASTWLQTDPDPEVVRRRVLEAVADGADLVIAIGGDGTVNPVGSALVGTGVALGVVPAGTGNVLAGNLGIPFNRAFALETAFEGADRVIDVGEVSYVLEHGERAARDFLVMAGFGLDVDMLAGANERVKRRFGWVAYVGPIAKSLTRRKRVTAGYTWTGAASTVESPLHSFIVGNCGGVSGGFRLLPEAEPDDRQLDLLAIRSAERRDLSPLANWLRPYNLPARWARRRTAATVAGNRPGGAFHYAKTLDATVSVTTPVTIQADGEILGDVTSARFALRAERLVVRVPAPPVE